MRVWYLASGNTHKALELRELFHGSLDLQSSPEGLEVEETGKTFTENAYIKARAYFNKFKNPTIADDSGLVINALPDILGVQSARFAPELPSYVDKCKKLIQLLEHQPDKSAYFVCILCFYFSEQEFYFFEGRLKGKISSDYKGEHGFGYDPIFIPERNPEDGLTLAELPDWKNKFSHRARACESALKFFKDSMDKSPKKS